MNSELIKYLEVALESYVACLALEWEYDSHSPSSFYILKSKGAKELINHLKDMINKDKVYQ